MEKNKEIKQHNKVLYAILNRLLRIYLRIAYGYKTPEKQSFQHEEGPVLVLGNHSGNLDFLFVMTALYPKRLNVVVASYFYNWKFLAKVLRFFGCIEKKQFRADIAAIQNMRTVVKRGDGLLIFPEGEVNGVGVNAREGFDDALVRMCRLLKCRVCTARVRGSHLTMPKWAKHTRRGKVEVEITQIISADNVRAMDDEALLERLRDGLEHDEYAAQLKDPVRFKGKKLAESLENMLYLCPRCKAEFHMRSAGSTLSCMKCGNTVVLNEYGFLHGASDADVCLADPSKWVQLQRECLQREIDNPDFCIEEDADIMYHLDDKSLAHTAVGSGRVSLKAGGIYYEGICDGKAVQLHFGFKNMQKLPFSFGRYFELPNEERLIAIAPAAKQAVAKFVLAYPIARQLFETHNKPVENKNEES